MGRRRLTPTSSERSSPFDVRLSATGIYEIVDGQQRITTFFLTLGEIRRALDEIAKLATSRGDLGLATQANADAEDIWDKYLSEETRDEKLNKVRLLKLSLSNVDSAFFKEIMTSGPDVVAQPKGTASHERLWAAASAIRDDLVRESVLSFRVPDRYAAVCRIRHALTISYVIHASSQDQVRAYRLFTGLNDRGHPLEAVDLLRTRTLEVGRDYEEHQKLANQLWEDNLMKATPTEVRSYLVAFLESQSGERAPSRDLFREYRRRWLAQSATDKASADGVVAFVGIWTRSSPHTAP